MPNSRVTPVWLRLAYSTLKSCSKRGDETALPLARDLCDSNVFMIDVCKLERRGKVSSWADDELNMSREPPDVRKGSWANLDEGNREVRIAPMIGHRQPSRSGPKSVDFVAKVENRTTLKISRKSIFRPLCCCVAFSATPEVRDRFWINRHGLSHRRAQIASAALKILVRHLKKTFETLSAKRRHLGGMTQTKPPSDLAFLLCEAV
jgi:hypothetical protein